MKYELKRRFLPPEVQEFFRNLIRSAPTALFAHLTFRSHVCEEEAKKTFRSFFDDLSKGRHKTIEWIVSIEADYSGTKGCALIRHIHAVLLTSEGLEPSTVERKWNTNIGDARCDYYDIKRDGIGYILKFSQHQDCDYQFSSNIDMFLAGHEAMNARRRRFLLCVIQPASPNATAHGSLRWLALKLAKTKEREL